MMPGAGRALSRELKLQTCRQVAVTCTWLSGARSYACRTLTVRYVLSCQSGNSAACSQGAEHVMLNCACTQDVLHLCNKSIYFRGVCHCAFYRPILDCSWRQAVHVSSVVQCSARQQSPPTDTADADAGTQSLWCRAAHLRVPREPQGMCRLLGSWGWYLCEGCIYSRAVWTGQPGGQLDMLIERCCHVCQVAFSKVPYKLCSGPAARALRISGPIHLQQQLRRDPRCAMTVLIGAVVVAGALYWNCRQEAASALWCSASYWACAHPRCCWAAAGSHQCCTGP
jgi:hypothetical protein